MKRKLKSKRRGKIFYKFNKKKAAIQIVPCNILRHNKYYNHFRIHNEKEAINYSLNKVCIRKSLLFHGLFDFYEIAVSYLQEKIRSKRKKRVFAVNSVYILLLFAFLLPKICFKIFIRWK